MTTIELHPEFQQLLAQLYGLSCLKHLRAELSMRSVTLSLSLTTQPGSDYQALVAQLTHNVGHDLRQSALLKSFRALGRREMWIPSIPLERVVATSFPPSRFQGDKRQMELAQLLSDLDSLAALEARFKEFFAVRELAARMIFHVRGGF